MLLFEIQKQKLKEKKQFLRPETIVLMMSLQFRFFYRKALYIDIQIDLSVVVYLW